MRRAPSTETPLAEALQDLESGAGRVPTLRIANGMPLTLEPNEVRRDVRARRPQLTSALRQSRTSTVCAVSSSACPRLRRGVRGDLLTALAVKELVRGNFELDKVSGQAWEYFPFVFLITALVRAQRSLRLP